LINQTQSLEGITDDILIAALSDLTKRALDQALDDGMPPKMVLRTVAETVGKDHMIYLACWAYIERRKSC